MSFWDYFYYVNIEMDSGQSEIKKKGKKILIFDLSIFWVYGHGAWRYRSLTFVVPGGDIK